MINIQHILVLLALVFVVSGSNPQPTNVHQESTQTTSDTNLSSRKLIHLRENNFVSINGVINADSASRFISDILKVSGDKIYIYITSPGGSIIDGNRMIQVMESLTSSGKLLVCIADKAASMAFVILQYCPHRTIMDHSILMQHQMSVSMN